MHGIGCSPESVSEENGYIVKQGDLEGVAELIRTVAWREFDRTRLEAEAAAAFSKEQRFKEYLELYSDVLNPNKPQDKE